MTGRMEMYLERVENAWSAVVQAEFDEAQEIAAHENELQPCLVCRTIGHDVWWRGYPVLDPGPCPPSDVLTDVTEACFCCFWGPGPIKIGESRYARLTREAHGGRDVHVEHRLKSGLWVKFEDRFGAAA